MELNKIIQGDCLESLKLLEDNSVDAIVTDPPYGLSFMGKKWDYDVPSQEIWEECLRVLKPGGYLLSFAGTRTQHRMAVRIEDAGFEIRDMIAWVYGSGFPKSLNIGKAIDKLNGRNTELYNEVGLYIKEQRNKMGYTLDDINKFCERVSIAALWESQTSEWVRLPTMKDWVILKEKLELDDRFDYVIEREEKEREKIGEKDVGYVSRDGAFNEKSCGFKKGTMDITKGTSEWEGWGTALKPAVEPVGIYTKPLQVEQIFAIIIDNIWNNLPASDVTQSLRDTQVKLNEVVSSVPKNVRINLLEKIDSAEFAQSLITSLHRRLKKEKENTVQENAVLSGEELSSKKKTQAGKEEGASLMDISTFVQLGDISENTVLLWKNISEELLNQTNTLTIETGIKKITELKTLRSCLIQNTGINTGLSKEIQPNLEPITVARKPLSEKTVAENVLKWGTGGINIDGSRVEITDTKNGFRPNSANKQYTPTDSFSGGRITEQHPQGRFPANFIHDGSDEVVEVFPNTKKGSASGYNWEESGQGDVPITKNIKSGVHFGDSGSASRFFYCAKASKSERNKGCEGLEEKEGIRTNAPRENEDAKTPTRTNNHPTVKPIALMEYLVKLVSKEGAVVLDPFAGSGSTLIACKNLNRNYIGMELDPEYIKICEARLKAVKKEATLF